MEGNPCEKMCFHTDRIGLSEVAEIEQVPEEQFHKYLNLYNRGSLNRMKKKLDSRYCKIILKSCFNKRLISKNT